MKLYSDNMKNTNISHSHLNVAVKIRFHHNTLCCNRQCFTNIIFIDILINSPPFCLCMLILSYLVAGDEFLVALTIKPPDFSNSGNLLLLCVNQIHTILHKRHKKLILHSIFSCLSSSLVIPDNIFIIWMIIT